MLFTTNSICYDLLAIPLEDGILDISWSVDTDTLKTIFENEGVQKILNFQDKVDFIIQIDNVDSFDSINLKEYKFSEIEKTYRGNIVFSAVIPFNKNKFDETNYFFRVKIADTSTEYNIYVNGTQIQDYISITDTWSSTKGFVIPKNYTKDLVEAMYTLVADFNAYNKEAKSANMYYIFQAVADTLNKEYKFISDQRNRLSINKSLPDTLVDTFGILFKFSDSYGITMEEYRRILQHLIIGYQHGGAWNYIKQVLKYLIGYIPELYTLKNFYPWILRKNGIEDPDWSIRNYYNPQTNFYLYKENYLNPKNKNQIILMDNKERLFTFIVKTKNFYNRNIDKEKIKAILDLLKSVYTKYSINIYDNTEPLDFTNYIYINDEQDYLLSSDDEYIMY